MSYWQQNLVDGRRAALARTLEWMTPLSGRLVHVVGMTDAEQKELCARGAQVSSNSPTEEADEHPSEPAIALDDSILWLALERLEEARRESLLQQLELRAAERLFLAIRMPWRWSRLDPSVDAPPTADPVELLRQVHLTTDFRLAREQTVRRRNSVIRICQFHRPTPATPG